MDVVSEAVFWKHPSSTGATFEVTLNSPSHVTVTVEEGIGDPTTEKGADVIVTGDGVKGANVSTGSISVDGDGVIPEQPHATARSRAVTSAKSDAAPLKSPLTSMRDSKPIRMSSWIWCAPRNPTKPYDKPSRRLWRWPKEKETANYV